MKWQWCDVRRRDGSIKRVRQYLWVGTLKHWLFWKPYGWVRSQNRWLSHLLFMPSRQWAGLYRYSDKDGSLVIAERNVNDHMRFNVPPKYRDRIEYTDLMPEPRSPDPLVRPGYLGWVYKPLGPHAV